MRKVIIPIIVSAAVVLLGAGYPRPDDPAHVPGSPGVDKGDMKDTEHNQLPEIPEGGMITISDRDWAATMADEPMLKLEDAMRALADGKFKAAAKDMQKAAVHTRVAAARSPEGLRPRLLASAQELDDLAKEVKAGTLTDAATLTPVFARDMQALAQHHAARAAEHWSDRHDVDAGYDLQAAAQDLGHALKWAPKQPDFDIGDMLTRAEYSADLLINGEQIVPEEVSGIVDGMQQASRTLGDDLRKSSS